MACIYNPSEPTEAIKYPRMWCTIIQGYCQFQVDDNPEYVETRESETYKVSTCFKTGKSAGGSKISSMGPHSISHEWKLSENLNLLPVDSNKFANHKIVSARITKYDDARFNEEIIPSIEEKITAAKAWYDSLPETSDDDPTEYRVFRYLPVRSKANALSQCYDEHNSTKFVENVYSALLRRFGPTDPLENFRHETKAFLGNSESINVSDNSVVFTTTVWDGDLESGLNAWWCGEYGIDVEIEVECWNVAHTQKPYYGPSMCPILRAYGCNGHK